MTEFRARHFEGGDWVRVALDGATIRSVDPAPGPARRSPDDDWVAPAFWDLQFNGRWGVSFSDPTVTPDAVAEIVRAQAALGAARVCPTLVTAPPEALRRGAAAVAAACEADRDVAGRVIGLHLEGPYISGFDGFRGAHPRAAVRDPDWDDFQALQDVSGGRIIILTLAPERAGAIPFIRKAVASGVTVALGHTAADYPTLRAAADAGATLSTHLGNGIASPLPRHPNPIFDQAAIDELSASFVADGYHLDPATLRVLVRAKSPGRSLLVSDASPLAGLPPGVHGAWEVDASGKIVVAGTPYLAGSNQGLEVGLNNLMAAADLDPPAAIATVTTNPARLLGRPEPALEPGREANLVRYRLIPAGATDSGPRRARIALSATCVGGSWTEAGDAPRPAHVRVETVPRWP